jgi:hypothetical protein
MYHEPLFGHDMMNFLPLFTKFLSFCQTLLSEVHTPYFYNFNKQTKKFWQGIIDLNTKLRKTLNARTLTPETDL